MFHQNICGLFSKKELVEEFLLRSNDRKILTLSETHSKVSDNASIYDIPGYTFINKPRICGKGGGVAAYISNSIQWNRREDLEEDSIECLWLEIL